MTELMEEFDLAAAKKYARKINAENKKKPKKVYIPCRIAEKEFEPYSVDTEQEWLSYHYPTFEHISKIRNKIGRQWGFMQPAIYITVGDYNRLNEYIDLLQLRINELLLESNQ